jgi:hypothetical protein
MDPGVRRDDSFKANKIRYVIPAQAGTHTTSTLAVNAR